MANNPKYDGVVDAVHYNPDGSVKWLRAYVRRGPTFSDLVLIPREDMIARINSGEVYMVGQRVIAMASTFEVDQQIRVANSSSGDVLVAGDNDPSNQDRLKGVPVI